MEPPTHRRQLSDRDINRITAGILILGLGAAVILFLTAVPPAADPLGYDPLTNKKYLRELQMYGGKANVFSAELMDWFNGLWHGYNLAYTVAVLTLVLAWLFWFFATLPEHSEDEGGNAEN